MVSPFLKSVQTMRQSKLQGTHTHTHTKTQSALYNNYVESISTRSTLDYSPKNTCINALKFACLIAHHNRFAPKK